MSTVIRPELSNNSKYFLPKHRYYELKHFCLQYPYWKRAYAELTDAKFPKFFISDSVETHYADRTADIAIAMSEYSRLMKIVEDAATDTDTDLKYYILMAVTEGRSFNYMKTVQDVPIEKDGWYDRYRKFFWILDKSRK